jgi:uncharacterized protein (DUF1684 family)
MIKSFLFFSLAALPLQALSQHSYTDSLLQHRLHYKQEFITSAHSPLKAADTGFLRFFTPDERFRVMSRVERTPDAPVFDMATRSGKTQPYRRYGMLHFTLQDKELTLEVYQSQTLKNKPGYEDHLFIPFNDLSNGEQTYGGGRYLDLKTTDIRNGRLVLDFNKAYNPYCAFASGYSCPIPPDANRLDVVIAAGEMAFGRETHE